MACPTPPLDLPLQLRPPHLGSMRSRLSSPSSPKGGSFAASSDPSAWAGSSGTICGRNCANSGHYKPLRACVHRIFVNSNSSRRRPEKIIAPACPRADNSSGSRSSSSGNSVAQPPSGQSSPTGNTAAQPPGSTGQNSINSPGTGVGPGPSPGSMR